jgi:drug/metabolite transporter (DMT)-like permease
VAAAAVIWGTNGVVVNSVHLNPYAIAFFRVSFASLALLTPLFLTQRREMKEATRSLTSLVVLGALLSIGWGTLFQSMKLIEVATADLLNYMAPVFVALLAPIFLSEKIRRATVLALAASMVGMVIISCHQNSQAVGLNVTGVAYGLAASLAYAGFVVLSKRVLRDLSGQVVAFYAYLVAAAFLSPSLIGVNLSLDLTSWVLLVALGVCNTGFAVTLYLKGLKSVEAHRAVVFTYLEPVSTAVFGYIFLAQHPTLHMIAGGFLILLAGYIVATNSGD